MVLDQPNRSCGRTDAPTTLARPSAQHQIDPTNDGRDVVHTTTSSEPTGNGGRLLTFRNILPSTVLLLTIAFILGVKPPSVPRLGLDAGWQIGLSWAHILGLEFGSDLVFTYGPLGFSEIPVFIGEQLSVIGLLLNFALSSIALAALVTTAYLSFRSVRVAAAFGLAGAVFLATSPAGGLSVAACIFTLLLSSMPTLQRRQHDYLLAIGSGLAAVAILVKFTAIVLIPILGLVLLLQRPRDELWRRSLLCLLSFVGTFFLIWIGMGYDLEGIWPYLRLSMELTKGFVDMSKENLDLAWGYPLLALASLIVVWHSTAIRRHNVAWSFNVILITYWAARQGFVRHDGHQVIFFIWLLPITLILILLRNQPGSSAVRRRGPENMAIALLALIALIGFYGTYLNDMPRRVTEASRRSLQVASLAFVPDQRTAEHDEAREAIREEADLPESIARHLAFGEWHAEPVDISILWAYDVDWMPLPIIQSFSAYTSHLDAVNAETLLLKSPRVLERVGSAIDGRRALWESPRHRLELACRYTVTEENGPWQILDRSAGGCVTEGVLGERLDVAPGDVIPVPELPPGPHLMVMTVQVDDSLMSAIVRMLWKDYYPVIIEVEGTAYRLPRGHAGAPLILCGDPGQGFPRPVPPTCPSTVSMQRSGSILFEFMSRGSG